MAMIDPHCEAAPQRRRLRHWLAGSAVALAGLGVAGFVDSQLATASSAAESFAQVMEAPATTTLVPSSTTTTSTRSRQIVDQLRVAGPITADVLLLRAAGFGSSALSTTAVPNDDKATTTTLAPTITAPPATAAPVTAPPTTAAPVTAPPTTAAPVTAPPTTAAPVTAPPTTAAPDTTTTTPPEPTLSAEDLAQLRACESSGNYQAVNPRGPYLGAYQFLQSTWDSVAARAGHSHLAGVSPTASSAGDQDAMAISLWRLSGPGQWPVCGGHLPPQP
ncbi:MAG: hypothetical protein GY698_13495 [Actinomycetia bacterium]|nr:hypothetical protein [Actinomycetes bacterium]